MRIVGLISGGKDSVFNMLQCIAAGHEIVGVANIAPDKEVEMDSYMYQSVGHEAVSLIAGALGLPIYRQTTKGKALNKSKSYVETLNDEVEDLVKLLKKVKTETVIEGISVGAIASDYQRTRVENVCSRLGFKCFAYLWNRDQAELLQEMIDAEVNAIIIKVAAIGLEPDIHLGMDLKTVQQHLIDLNRKFGVSICGEGGEYETLTLDCPLFHRKITITESENVILSNDAFAPVASLNVKNASLTPKFWGSDDPVHSLQARLAHIKAVVKHPYDYIKDIFDEVSENIFPQNPKKPSSLNLPFPFENDEELVDQPSGSLNEYWKKQYTSKSSVGISYPLPTIDLTNVRINYSTGWCAIGNVNGENAEDALRRLKKHLERIGFRFDDIVMVNLYVREMSEFVKINKIYSHYFPSVQPPARSCVATQLPPDVAVIVSVVGHKLISRSLKALSSAQLFEREVMHVQSISHWAPANIGPYSQCVKVGELYYLAGQIPLIPGTMEILNKPIFFQCKLTLRHIQRVMKALNESLNFQNILQAICYVTSKEIAPDIYSMWIYITGNEKTPVTVVEVKELPKNSQVEWEVIACGNLEPSVLLESQMTNEYFLQMKRCVHTNPFASCIVAKVSPPKNVKNRKIGLGSGTYLKILKQCVQFLRSNLENIGTPLCVLKIFFKSSETVITTVINDVIKSCSECKVVVTAIPVFGCEDPNVLLTVSGICH